MKCDECGNETNGIVCKKCGLVIDHRPIAQGIDGYEPRRWDITTLYAANVRIWDSPLSPKTRKKSMAFNPRYQKNYNDYVYIKAYEAITKICTSIKIPNLVRFEALNIFKGIRVKDPNFFKKIKLAPTYLACIKIACKMNDFPIMNHELAEAIDYKLDKDDTNLTYMEKKFNKAYKEILKLYNMRISAPLYPNFITYACGQLKLPYTFTKIIYDQYIIFRPFLESHFKLEGYVLAFIYLEAKKQHINITLKILEKTFHISSLTISNRKKEILKKVIKN